MKVEGGIELRIEHLIDMHRVLVSAKKSTDFQNAINYLLNWLYLGESGDIGLRMINRC